MRANAHVLAPAFYSDMKCTLMKHDKPVESNNLNRLSTPYCTAAPDSEKD